MVNDCFENNQNMRAGLKPAPTDGFPNNYAFYSQRPQGIVPTDLSIMHVYNEGVSKLNLSKIKLSKCKLIFNFSKNIAVSET